MLLQYLNMILAILAWMYGIPVDAPPPPRHTAAQQVAITNLVSRAVDFVKRLQLPKAGQLEHLLPDWVQGISRPAGPQYANLEADKVDCPEEAAAVDPLLRLPPELQSLLCDPDQLFPAPPPGLDCFGEFNAGARDEYVKLVAKQLRCGKVGLSSSPRAGGTVLAVGKPGGNRQREVWHGRRVSQAAVAPECPRHLASPSALIHIECHQNAPCRVSKRDAKCWFDQLRLPESLRRWMARPPVTTEELAKIGGLTESEQAAVLESGESWRDGPYYPVSRVWPMGFSWSSFVAQEELLGICNQAGLSEDCILSCDKITPLSFDVAFAAATDDVMIFSTAGEGRTLTAANDFDIAMASRGAARNTAKDVNDALNATCVGVNLEEGFFLGVPPGRCLAMAVGVLQVLCCRNLSPKHLHQLLGTLQWFDLLRRPKLAVYNAVYQFVQDDGDATPKRVPSSVCLELAASFALGVYWWTDLRRPFLPLLSATDASTEYGFGASVARVPVSLVRRLARCAEKKGDFVVLDGGTLHGAAATRLGRAHRLDISLDDFVDVFSVRYKRKAHINVLEGEAFVLWLRWLLRCRRHHATRVVVLVDSAVWAGAASKGRSSTQLNRLLRQAAALEMLGDLHVHIVLVPSGENPADLPSRGVRRRGLRVGRNSAASSSCLWPSPA